MQEKRLIEFKFNQLEILFNNNIPEIIIERINFFKELDDEYKHNTYERDKDDITIFSSRLIKNKAWRGLWLKATGMDELLYISYMSEVIKYYKKNKTFNAVEKYKRSHRKELHVPYSISVVNLDFNNLLKGFKNVNER